MKVRILYTDGLGDFMEGIYDKPTHSNDEIVVESVMTGVCRSDIDMMQGSFPLLPIHMMGHEGLGIVTKVGSNITNVKVGDYVATRGEPAYADLYNCKAGNFVQVDELHPRYILEPVACGINLIHNNIADIIKRCGPESRILIIGSGFLAYTAYRYIMNLNLLYKDLDLVGGSNSDLFHNQIPHPNGKYNIIIDISSNPDYLNDDIYEDNGLLIMASPKFPDIGSDLSNLLWRNMTIKMPSPRALGFYECMKEADMFVRTDVINIDKFWTKGYNRDTEWQQAFKDALCRPAGYNRGYIKW
jgi:hypothetical protein